MTREEAILKMQDSLKDDKPQYAMSIVRMVETHGWRYVPPDSVVVPREPTEAMEDAALDAGLDINWNYEARGEPGGPKDVYRAMIQAEKVKPTALAGSASSPPAA